MSPQLLNGFLDVAKDNTSKDLETCGVLGAFLKGGTYYITTLIIPKQDATSSSCQAVNEEEIFAIQNEQSLIPVGWIHVMLPEAVAIVMAPTDASSALAKGPDVSSWIGLSPGTAKALMAMEVHLQ
ncbi:hypothetical protein OSB04_008928 [Centaurea solstitialis]|uniref:JAB1/MPN/MOV34 metalloenzyme domain-containing protein n=1 Tax=Centaurea solstitialis TaxID=347529 RepID=A0AA38U787_9ASTR|nr:hypothetical protein OSB04_008928 [Centaurea solstitialis]